MTFKMIKKISIGQKATSIALTQNHIVSTTAMDDFSLVIDLNQEGKKAISVQKLTGPAGRNQVLYAGGNTVVELMNARYHALVAYGGKAFNFAFGHRQINGVAVSNDGESVAFFLDEMTIPLEQMYYDKVDNVYVVSMAEVVLAGLETADNQVFDLGITKEEVAKLSQLGLVKTLRPSLHDDRTAPYFKVVSGEFVPGKEGLFLTVYDANMSALSCFVYAVDGEGIDFAFLDAHPNQGENNRCCVVGDVAYTISNKNDVLHGYDLKDQASFSIQLKNKQLMDVVGFKNHLFCLVWNTDNELYELLNHDFEVIMTDDDLGAIAVSQEYLAMSRGKYVYLYE